MPKKISVVTTHLQPKAAKRNDKIIKRKAALIPILTKASLQASTRVTDNSPTKSLFPSVVSALKSSVTGPRDSPFWKSRTIFLGRTKSPGKSSVRSFLRNLVKREVTK